MPVLGADSQRTVNCKVTMQWWLHLWMYRSCLIEGTWPGAPAGTDIQPDAHSYHLGKRGFLLYMVCSEEAINTCARALFSESHRGVFLAGSCPARIVPIACQRTSKLQHPGRLPPPHPTEERRTWVCLFSVALFPADPVTCESWECTVVTWLQLFFFGERKRQKSLWLKSRSVKMVLQL